MIRSICIAILLIHVGSVGAFAAACGPGCSWQLLSENYAGFWYTRADSPLPDCSLYQNGTTLLHSYYVSCPQNGDTYYCRYDRRYKNVCNSPTPENFPRGGGSGSGNGGGLNVGPDEICPTNSGSENPGGYGPGGHY